MSVGPTELVVILLVVLLLFGSRFAGLGKGIGEAIREFKRGIGGESDDRAKTKQEPAEAKPPHQLAGHVAAPAGSGEAVEPAVDASNQTETSRPKEPSTSTAEPFESDKI